MKRYKILLLGLIFFLVGCNIDTGGGATLTGDPMDVNQVQIYYDPIDKKLLEFNPNGNSSRILNSDPNSYAYDVNGADILFVIGDSNQHKFKLVEIDGANLTTVHEFSQGEDVLPLGYTNGRIYFVRSFYENGKEVTDKRTISYIDVKTEEVDDIPSITGYVVDGIVSPNNIYYTKFNNQKNYFELYKKSIEEGKRGDPPELLSVGYETPDLYLSKDLFNEREIISLYASDKHRIYSKEESWPKFEENYFKPSSVIGIDKQEDGKMQLTFVDKRSREVMNEVYNVVGIRFEEDTIVVATTDLGASKY